MAKGCSRCGTENVDDAAFCHACGHGLLPATGTDVLCLACGAFNRAGTRFCVKCGTDQTEKASSPLFAPTQAPEQYTLPRSASAASVEARPMPRRRPAGLRIGVVALLLALVGAAAWWAGSSRAPAAPTVDAAPAAPAPVAPVVEPAPAVVPPAASASAMLTELSDEQEARQKLAREARAKAQRQQREQAASQAAAARDAEQEAARRRADEAIARTPPSAPAAAPPAVIAAAPQTAQEVCAGRNVIMRTLCEARECVRRERADEALCQRLRAADERRRQSQE